MAKKKKKFKKKISQNLSERIAQIEKEKLMATPVASSKPARKASSIADAGGSQVLSPKSSGIESKEVATTEEDKYAYVKRDVKRDFLIIAILLLLLVATAVINLKTSYLKDASDWIYKTLNLKV